VYGHRSNDGGFGFKEVICGRGLKKENIAVNLPARDEATGNQSVVKMRS